MCIGGVERTRASRIESPEPAYILQTNLNKSSDAATDSTRITLSVDFPINSYSVDPEFSDNSFVLDSLRRIIVRAGVDPSFSIHDITVSGSASPDGRYRSNMELARRRMLALCDYMVRHFDLPEEIRVSPGRCHISWPGFRDAVSESAIPEASRILEISAVGDDSSSEDSDRRLRRLKEMNGGRTWRTLASEILPQLRSAVGITLSTDIQCVDSPDSVSEPPRESVPVPVPEPVSDPCPISGSDGETCGLPQWHIGTNAVEWAMAIVNLTGEYDFASRWSAVLSVHYSAWNYGISERKFRTFILRPEVRYWMRDCHKGFFLNAHLQMAAYNFALSGWNYRIQDAGGRHPALGGGVGIGYRVNLDGSRRWSFQADLGIGVYHLKYDRFENRGNGPLVDTGSRVWTGIDHFGLSLIYNFKPRKR